MATVALNRMTQRPLHLIDSTEFAQRLQTDLEQGLPEAEVAIRRTRYGPNEFKLKRKPPGSIPSGALHVTVIRGGQYVAVNSNQLVIGDLVQLRTGDLVPADMRIIRSTGLKVSSSLMGDSDLETKSIRCTDDNPLRSENMLFWGSVVTEGSCLAVVTATGEHTFLAQSDSAAPVTRRLHKPPCLTGRYTQLLLRHNVAVRKPEAITALRDVTHLVFNLHYVCERSVSDVVGIYCSGQLFDHTTLPAAALGAAGSVASIPTLVDSLEAPLEHSDPPARGSAPAADPATETRAASPLPTAAAAAIAPAGVTLSLPPSPTASTTPATLPELSAAAAAAMDELSEGGAGPVGYSRSAGPVSVPFSTLRALSVSAVLSSHAKMSQGMALGSPADAALLQFFGAICGAEAIRAMFSETASRPYQPSLRFATTVHERRDRAGHLVNAVGAPEVLLSLCDTVLSDSGEESLDAVQRARIEAVAAAMSASGHRVLGLCWGPLALEPGVSPEDAPLRHLCFLGLVALAIQFRPHAEAAVRRCKEIGVKPVLFSGAHPDLVKVVAERLGLLSSARSRVITGYSYVTDFTPLLSDQDVAFARVRPSDKRRLVDALQAQSCVVAITGDHPNDVPAMEQADVAFVAGLCSGSVEQAASSAVVLDDSLASMVDAIAGVKTNRPRDRCCALM